MTQKQTSPHSPSRLNSGSPIHVAVTGAAGFIGSHVVEELLRSGAASPHSIVSVDKLEYFSSRPEMKDLEFGTQMDLEVFQAQLKSGKPVLTKSGPLQWIVHMGACTDTTELDPGVHKKLNLDYSKDIWNYCSKNGVGLIYASSAATYGGGELGYDDDESKMTELKPLNPYGQSKLDFDLWALDQEKRGNSPPAWSGFKFFNVYGYRERHKGKMASVVMHATDQTLATGKVRLFKSHKEGIADGMQKRDFVFIGDVISILTFARTKPLKRGIFNLGSGQARTFLELTHNVFDALKRPRNIEFFDTPIELRERYQYFTQANMDKIRSEGYSIEFSPVEKGVSESVRQLLNLRAKSTS